MAFSVFLKNAVFLAREFFRPTRFRSGRPVATRAASRAAEKDLAVLYHEIRNCTSILKGNALFLRQQLTCEKDRAPVERIERAAASIERIAREMMVPSYPEPPAPMENLDLPELIRECAEDHFPGRLDAFRLEYQGTLPRICGDPGKLRQAFVNIFKNSFEAHAVHIRIRMAPAGNFLRILIEDDGMGCPHGELGKIFLPFRTSKRGQGGMGIGLALVKVIVEGHGGSIWAAAPQGARAGGLVMHITLPAAPGSPEGASSEGIRRGAVAA